MSRTGNFFIVMRIDLKHDPAVLSMAVELNQRPEVVVGYLHSVWGWFASQTEGGMAHGASIQALEVATNLHDFPQMMEKRGWLKEWKDDQGKPTLEIPNWERWFGGSEQRKQYERERKQKQRENSDKKVVRDNVRDNVGTSSGQFAPTGTGTGTGTETKKNLSGESEGDRRGGSPETFDNFWKAYPRRNGIRKGKGDARRLFNALSDEDQLLAIQAAKVLAESKEMPKDANRWLKADWREWLDADTVVPDKPKPGEPGFQSRACTAAELEALKPGDISG